MNKGNLYVQELAYAVVDATNLDDWESFADVLGVERIRDQDLLDLRIDKRPFRIRIQQADADGLSALGWLAIDELSMNSVADLIRARGMEINWFSDDELAARRITGGFSFQNFDEVQFAHEVVLGIPDEASPVLGQGVTGFVTGPTGMGHVVFASSNVEAFDELYCGTFGMSLREDIPTLRGGRGHFFGCNPRHHSAAVIANGRPPSVAHLMLETRTIDDVGTTRDRVRDAGYRLGGLGRHRTDHMFSFYVMTPAGFELEFGCDGLQIFDEEAWPTVKESTRLRVWGHDLIEPAK